MSEEFITACIGHGLVEIPSKNGRFPRIYPFKAARGPKAKPRKLNDFKDLVIVLETIDSNPGRSHVTLASRHCYSAVWW